MKILLFLKIYSCCINLSKLPSREELISEITGMVGSPGSLLSQLVSSPGSNIAGITVALEEQKAA